jgi:hypothetical protein
MKPILHWSAYAANVGQGPCGGEATNSKLKWEGRKSEESNASALMLPFFDGSKSDLLHLYEWSGYF